MLVETKAKNIKPTDKPFADGTVTGLRLLPSSSRGHGKWQLRYVSPESTKRRDMGLGTYPEVSIVRARLLATEARNMIALGTDPIDVRASIKIDARKQNKDYSFEDAAKQVHNDLRDGWKNKKHIDQWINTLTTYVFPKIGHLPVADLKAVDFANTLRPIWIEKAETASRVKQRCHAVMKWCFANELVSGNPVDLVDKLLPKQPSPSSRVQHQPSMPWRDIPQFIKAEVSTGSNVTRSLLEFIILTAVRSGEAREMTWSEIDLDTKIWTIPASRMKTPTLHRIPLSKRALEILERQRGGNKNNLVFPSPTSKRVLSDMALTKFLRDKKTKSDAPGRHATAHGFRSSFRDWASENGYSRDLAERALAHTIKNQSEAAYHRTDLIDQRRPMMEAWSSYISS